MNGTKTIAMEAGNRIELPAEWVDALGLQGLVILDKTDGGILVRPCPPATWDEIFATKLPIAPPAPGPDGFEVSTDDLLF